MRFERLLGFSVFLLIPFLGGNHLTLLHVTIDRFWIETTFILLMLAGIVLAYLQKRSANGSFYKFLVFFCPFFVVAILSLTYTWSTFNTLNEINVLLWALGGAFLFSVTSHREDLLKGLVAGAALSALCAVWQALVLFPSLLEIYKEGGYAAMLKEHTVPFSSFLNQNMLGGYCASILPLGLYFAFLRLRKSYFVAACLIIVGILLSLSRLAVLACLPSCAIIAGFIVKERGVKGLLPLAACVGIALCAVLLIVYSPRQVANAGIQSTLEGKVQRSYQEAKTLNLRTDIWKTGLKAFQEKPFLGYGAGNFVYAYQKYYEARHYTKVAHGTLIKIAVELGVIGLLCFLGYCFGVARDSMRSQKDHLAPIIALSALALFLFGLLDFSFDTGAHVVTFFVLSSVCFAPIMSAVPHLAKKALPLVLVLPILGSFIYTARADSSRRFLEDAMTLKSGGSTEEVRQLLTEAENAMPLNNNASVHLISSLISSYGNEKDQLQKENLRADLLRRVGMLENRRDKDPELFFVLGMAKQITGYGISSCSYMDRALHYYPSSACYALSAATCFAGHGQIEKALSVITSLKPYYDNYRKWSYPDGLFVYKIKDLEAELRYSKGDREGAIALVRQNLESARRGEFVIADWRARESISKNALVALLEQRVRSVESRSANDERGTGQIATY